MARNAGVAHLLANLGDLLLDQVVHGPGLLKAADVKEEVREDLLAVLGVAHLGVELGGVELALGARHGGHGTDAGLRRHVEALGHAHNGVAVAHPHGLLERGARKQSRAVIAGDGCGAILAHLGMADLAAERHGHNLVPVAKTQDRQAQVENSRVDGRRVLGIDARGTTRKDEGRGLHRADLVRGDVAGHNLRIDMQVAHAAGDELAVLCAEVEYEHLICGSGCVLGHGSPLWRRRAAASL